MPNQVSSSSVMGRARHLAPLAIAAFFLWPLLAACGGTGVAGGASSPTTSAAAGVNPPASVASAGSALPGSPAPAPSAPLSSASPSADSSATDQAEAAA